MKKRTYFAEMKDKLNKATLAMEEEQSLAASRRRQRKARRLALLITGVVVGLIVYLFYSGAAGFRQLFSLVSNQVLYNPYSLLGVFIGFAGLTMSWIGNKKMASAKNNRKKPSAIVDKFYESGLLLLKLMSIMLIVISAFSAPRLLTGLVVIEKGVQQLAVSALNFLSAGTILSSLALTAMITVCSLLMVNIMEAVFKSYLRDPKMKKEDAYESAKSLIPTASKSTSLQKYAYTNKMQYAANDHAYHPSENVISSIDRPTSEQSTTSLRPQF